MVAAGTQKAMLLQKDLMEKDVDVCFFIFVFCRIVSLFSGVKSLKRILDYIHGYWETWNVLYGVLYCCKASEALGLPLYIICV